MTKLFLLLVGILFSAAPLLAEVTVEIEPTEKAQFEKESTQEARGPLIIGNAGTRSQGLSFGPMQDDGGPELSLSLEKSRPGQLLLKANGDFPTQKFKLKACLEPFAMSGSYLQINYLACDTNAFEVELNKVKNIAPGFYRLGILSGESHIRNGDESYYPYFIQIKSGVQSRISLPVIRTPPYQVENGTMCLSLYERTSSPLTQNAYLMRAWSSWYVQEYLWSPSDLGGIAKFDEKIRSLVRFVPTNDGPDVIYYQEYEPNHQTSVATPSYVYKGSKAVPVYGNPEPSHINEEKVTPGPRIIAKLGQAFVFPPGDYKMRVYIGTQDCLQDLDGQVYWQNLSVPGVTVDDVGTVVPRD